MMSVPPEDAVSASPKWSIPGAGSCHRGPVEFCPGIYEHAAALIGRSPWDVSRSADGLVEAHGAAWERYGHRLVVVGIDVYNVEPEALGAAVAEPQGNQVPALAGHPLEELAGLVALPGFDPCAGRFPIVLRAARRLASHCRGAEVRVPVCGPMALASGLVGMENLLIGLLEDGAAADEALAALFPFQAGWLRAIQQAGARPLFFESGTTPPLLPATLFEEIEARHLRRLFDEAAGIFGERPPCIIGGDAAPIARALLATGPGYVIAPSETDQAAFLAVAQDFPETHVRVNMSATLLCSGDWSAIGSEAMRVLHLAGTRSNTSVGCGVVPFDADPSTVDRLRHLFLNQPASLTPLQHHDENRFTT